MTLIPFTAHTALAVLALPAVAVTLTACSSSTPHPAVQATSSTSTASASVAAPTSSASHRPSPAPPTRTAGRTTDLSSPAQVTDAYARVTLGDKTLWTERNQPQPDDVFARLSPFLTPGANDNLHRGKAEDVFHAMAFANPSRGHTTGLGLVSTSGARCTPSGATASCTETVSATVRRTGQPNFTIVRTIHVTLVPAAVKGSASWLIDQIHNNDQIS